MKLSHSEVEFLIERLNNGDPIPEDYKHKLFPIKQIEYELAYAGKMRKEDVFANEDGVFPVPLQVEKKYNSSHVDDEWTNMIVFGDNLQFLKTVYENKDPLIKDKVKDKVKLIYIDPPYATESDFKTVKGQNAYSDKKRGADFIEFLRRRLIMAKSILAHDGTIYVHTDARKGHYIKVIMDEIFYDFDFGEIIWVCGLLGSGSFYPKAHETIYCYKRKGNNFESPKRLGLSKRITKALQKDDEGWFYTRGRESSGGLNYLKSYISNDPNITKEEAIATANQSRLQPVWSVWVGKEEIASAYNDYPVGTYAYTPTDSWNYPTQKPERLIKRIIEASSKKGDIVLDFFAGSGTTIAVAEKLNRKWIACDVGKLAFYTMQKRILNIEHSRCLEEHKKLYDKKHRSFITVNTGIYDLNKLFELNKDHYTEFVMNLFEVEIINKRIGGIRIDGVRKDGYHCIIYPYWNFKDAEVNLEYLEDLHSYIGNKIYERFYIIAPANYVNFITDYHEIGSIKYYFLKVPYQVIKELHKSHFKKIRQPQSKNKVNDLEDVIGFHFIRQPYVKSEVVLNDNKIQIYIKEFISDYTEETTDKDMGNFESLAMVLIDNNYDDNIFIMDNYFFASDLLPQVKKDEDEDTIKKELKQQKEILIELNRDECGKKVMVLYVDIYGNEFKEAFSVEE